MSFLCKTNLLLSCKCLRLKRLSWLPLDQLKKQLNFSSALPLFSVTKKCFKEKHLCKIAWVVLGHEIWVFVATLLKNKKKNSELTSEMGFTLHLNWSIKCWLALDLRVPSPPTPNKSCSVNLFLMQNFNSTFIYSNLVRLFVHGISAAIAKL